MDWKGHTLFGSVLLSIFLLGDVFYLHWLNLEYLKYLIYIPLLLLSFLIVDIDAVISKPKIVITFLLIFLSIAGYFVYSPIFSIICICFLGVLWLINPIFGHRGFIHSLLFISIISIPLFFIDFKLMILFFIGAYTHLLLDGIPFKLI